MISRVEEADLEEVGRIISKEFPYTNITTEKLGQRIGRDSAHIFKLMERGRIAGIVDLGIEGTIGKINGLVVVEKFRNRNFGKLLLDYALEFLRANRVDEINLIVKQDNCRAKKIYGDSGFITTGILDKKIGGSVVEGMRLVINPWLLSYLR